MLRKVYAGKGSVAKKKKKISGRDPQGAWCHEVIGSTTASDKLTLTLTDSG
jgi:hypothetical protein